MHTPSINPLMAGARLPGVIVRLPSRGLFYDNGELSDDVENGEVEVFPMSAYDEVFMRSVNHIINGTAITSVFSHCIPQVLKPMELFGKDVDHLLMILRSVTYGNEIDLIYKHTCAAPEQTHTIDISTLIAQTTDLDPTSVATKFAITMPSGQLVEIRPVRFKDTVHLMQNSANFEKMTNVEIKNILIDSTIRIVHSVDGITDREQIEEWGATIPTKWFSKIGDALNAMEHWGPNLGYKTTCPDCGEEITIDVPLNPLSFFLD